MPSKLSPGSSEGEPLLDPVQQEHKREKQERSDEETVLHRFLREATVWGSQDNGLLVISVFLLCMVLLNLFALVWGLAHPEQLHSWWMIFIELFLTTVLVVEICFKGLRHFVLEYSDSFWDCENIFDIAIATVSLMATILILTKADQADDSVDDDSIAIRMLRDGARIMRNIIFFRDMIRLQVRFCEKHPNGCGCHLRPSPTGNRKFAEKETLDDDDQADPVRFDGEHAKEFEDEVVASASWKPREADVTPVGTPDQSKQFEEDTEAIPPMNLAEGSLMDKASNIEKEEVVL